MRKLKIVFAGTDDFARKSLAVLKAQPDFEIIAVLTPLDQPAARGHRLTAPPVKLWAEQKKIPVWQIQKFDSRICQELKKLKPDFLVVVAFRFLLPVAVLRLPKFGCVNLHASLLPKFRGASPITAAILAGEQKTGVSFQQVQRRLDAGPVFASFEIPLTQTKAVLSQKLAQLGAENFPTILRQIAKGKLRPKKQVEAQASFCAKLNKAEGQVNFAQDAAELLVRKLRAFAPWPGVWTIWENQVLKLCDFAQGRREAGNERIPTAQVFRQRGKVWVALQNEALELKRVQLAGKKILPIEVFCRGKPNFVGSQLGKIKLKKLLLATANPSKVREISAGLKQFNWEIVTLDTFGSLKLPPESGKTFAENARIKAEFCCRATGLPTLADDSGILLRALPGEFGVKTARAFGENLADKIWLEKFLAKVRGASSRRATFVCVLAFAYPRLPTQFFRGQVEGEILRRPAAPLLPGIPLSSVFRPLNSTKVFAALTPRQKARFSHRGLALNKFNLQV